MKVEKTLPPAAVSTSKPGTAESKTSASVSTSKPGRSQVAAAGSTDSKVTKTTVTKDDRQASASPPPLKKTKCLFCSIYCWRVLMLHINVDMY